ncbi:MAG: glycosyltransferase, partial [Bacteroidota bacterium]
GLYSQDVTSYYMTHQVNVIMPLYLKPFQPLARFMHRCLIKNYDACLIPDFDDDGGLSGKLAHKPGGFKFLHKYTGPLSGFSEIEPKSFENIPDVLAVVSGPEPQRTIFIKRLVDVFSNDKRQVWIVAGQPECDYDHIDEHIRIINHLKRSELKYLMGHVPVLIARSGYTTLMDLHVLKRKAILIPTPGQTEQEYLAGYFQKRFNFKVIDQKKIHASELFKPDHCGEWPHHRNQKSCNISGIFTS